MTQKKKPNLVDETGQLTPEQLAVIEEALIEAGLFVRDEEGELVPTGVVKEGDTANILVEIDEDGELVNAEQLEDWEVPIYDKPH